MRRWKYLIAVVPIAFALSWWAFAEMERSHANEQREELLERLERWRDTRMDEPGGNLARAWASCLKRLDANDGDRPKRNTCKLFAGQGVTSALVAFEFDGEYLPVVESRIPDLAIEGRFVVDVVGGPGDEPFYSNPAETVEMVEEFQGNDAVSYVGGIMEERPQYQLMQRGFTIASIAYLGTTVRTLAASDEIKSAIREVGLVIDHYHDELDGEPPLITTSLGNHLVLGALGKERLEGMKVLSLVPVMDGLQHHLKNATAKDSWTSPDVLSGDWVWRNVYRRDGNQLRFVHRRIFDQREFIPQYIGEVNLPWRKIQPKQSCSAVVLGKRDPRTTAYLASQDSLPPHLQVWDAGHSLLLDAPLRSRALYAEFADCLLEGQAPTD